MNNYYIIDGHLKNFPSQTELDEADHFIKVIEGKEGIVRENWQINTKTFLSFSYNLEDTDFTDLDSHHSKVFHIRKENLSKYGSCYPKIITHPAPIYISSIYNLHSIMIPKSYVTEDGIKDLDKILY